MGIFPWQDLFFGEVAIFKGIGESPPHPPAQRTPPNTYATLGLHKILYLREIYNINKKIPCMFDEDQSMFRHIIRIPWSGWFLLSLMIGLSRKILQYYDEPYSNSLDFEKVRKKNMR